VAVPSWVETAGLLLGDWTWPLELVVAVRDEVRLSWEEPTPLEEKLHDHDEALYLIDKFKLHNEKS
jgi:hypothetical protein